MYNVEKYIETCIDSILAQTFTDFEVIVIDDCSTDRSYEIVSKTYCTESSEKCDPRVRLLQNFKNSNLSFTRNIGLECSRGEYIFFIDSDDAILTNTIEILVNAADESGAGVVYMNQCFQNKINNPNLSFEKNYSFLNQNDFSKMTCKNPTPRFLSTDIQERLDKEYFQYGIFVTAWIKIQRRDCLVKNKICFPVIRRREDVLFNFAELCLIEKIQVIDACCYFYRKRNDSITHADPKKTIHEVIESLPEAMNFVDQVIQSINCTESIRNNIRNTIERQTLKVYLNICFSTAYRNKMPRDETNALFLELLKDPKIHDPKLMRTLLYCIANSKD